MTKDEAKSILNLMGESFEDINEEWEWRVFEYKKKFLMPPINPLLWAHKRKHLHRLVQAEKTLGLRGEMGGLTEIAEFDFHGLDTKEQFLQWSRDEAFFKGKLSDCLSYQSILAVFTATISRFAQFVAALPNPMDSEPTDAEKAKPFSILELASIPPDTFSKLPEAIGEIIRLKKLVIAINEL